MTLLALLSFAQAADPVAPEGTLDLAAFTAEVLAANPEADAAEAAVQEAAARRTAAGALPDPMLDLEIPPLSFAAMPAWRAELSQTLPAFGERRADRAMADADHDAAAADLAMVRLELAEMAAMAWADWYVVHRELALVEETRRLLSDIEGAVAARVGVGRASTLELFQVRSEAGGLVAGQRGLEARRAVLAVQLNQLLHRPSGSPVPPPPAVPPTEAPEPPPGPHPAVLEAEAMRRGAAAAVAMARADRLPMVGWMLGWDVMAADPHDQWMIGVSLSLPVSVRARAAALAGAEAGERRAEATTALAEDRTAAARAEAAARLSGARAVVTSIEAELLPPSRQALEAARAAYGAGTGELRPLLEAERALLAAELRLAEAQGELALRSRLAGLAVAGTP